MATNGRIRIGILFGGRSAEHEVSVRSARNVVAALDSNKYEPVLIGIGRDGRWHLGDAGRLMLDSQKLLTVSDVSGAGEVTLLPRDREVAVVAPGREAPLAYVDVVFPILHGPFGEDGTVQGLLKLANVPFIGADVLGSAVGMDKDVMKKLLRDAGLPIGKFVTLTAGQKDSYSVDEVFKALGSPVFVKPANLGSSVGVSKAATPDELKSAVANAFRFDRKVVIEEFIKARELECAVLGNENPKASVVGEIVTGSQHEFYSYEAKYIDCEGQKIEIPARIPEEVSNTIRGLAVQSFLALNCEGMGRVDFFYADDGRILVNEINTLPGFTSISMYPKLWEATGIGYAALIDNLVDLAMRRFEEQSALIDTP